MNENANSPTADQPRRRPARPSKRLVAVIDVGATSIRMAIAEIDAAGGVRVLETLNQGVSLGKDTFTRGQIERGTIEDCARVLRSYRRLLREYGITAGDRIRTVATSAVREASNRLAFIDRIYIATGLKVEPIDEAEVSRITYLGVQPHLQAEPRLASAHTIITEVGGGSTELLLVHGEDVEFSNTYRLGSLRLRKTLETYRAPTVKVRPIMEKQIRRTVQQVKQHVPPESRVEMITLGGDMRFAAHQLLPDWDPQSLAAIPTRRLERLTDQILSFSEDEIVQKYHLSFPAAETLGPALLAYVEMARGFGLEQVLVTNVNLRDGLLKEMAVNEYWTEEFANQILRSATDLAEKYQVDEAHALHTAEICEQLFDQLQEEHHLPLRYRLILSLAARLHEVGLFISQRAHHKHALYIIRNSEVFGVGRRDLLLVALVARYQRRRSPQPTHEGYATLGREHRVAVAKMAALLRIAIALDESRSQRIRDIRCQREGDRLALIAPRVEDLSLEQLALRQNSSLFEEVFGLPVLLRGAPEG